MCIQWTRVLYSVVITGQCNPPISQFNSLCNEFTSVWSMFIYNIHVHGYLFVRKLVRISIGLTVMQSFI